MLEFNTKREMKEGLRSGIFGNRFRVWKRPEDIDADYTGTIYIRDNKVAAEPKFFIPQNELHKHDLSNADLYESPENLFRPIQGEVIGNELLYRVGSSLALRDALNDSPQWASGSLVNHVLHAHMSHKSFCRIQEFRDYYFDHAIEFSEFGACVGTENERLIIWEVRKF